MKYATTIIRLLTLAALAALMNCTIIRPPEKFVFDPYARKIHHWNSEGEFTAGLTASDLRALEGIEGYDTLKRQFDIYAEYHKK